jgi:hypothetical protein
MTSDFPQLLISDETIDLFYCRSLVTKFVAKDHHLTGFNLSREWEIDHEVFLNLMKQQLSVYMQHYGLLFGVHFPKRYGYEHFTITNLFDTTLHTSVTSYNSARRFLSFYWYLTTVPVDGETVFGWEQDKGLLSITPIAGRCVMFPSTWSYPHWDQQPGPSKIVVTGYLHYL